MGLGEDPDVGIYFPDFSILARLSTVSFGSGRSSVPGGYVHSGIDDGSWMFFA